MSKELEKSKCIMVNYCPHNINKKKKRQKVQNKINMCIQLALSFKQQNNHCYTVLISLSFCYSLVFAFLFTK